MAAIRGRHQPNSRRDCGTFRDQNQAWKRDAGKQMMHCALYTRIQADRRVRDALTEYALDAHCPIYFETGKSRGKSRAPEIHERVLLPRVVFVRIAPEDYHAAQASRAWRDVLARLDIPAREWTRVERWVNDANDEAEMVMARIRAGEMVEHYRPGEELTVIGGPLDGQIVRFVETMHGCDDLTTRIRARVEMLGGWVPVEVDPLGVKKP